MTLRVYYSTHFLGHLSDRQHLKINPVSVNKYLRRVHDFYIHAVVMNSSIIFSYLQALSNKAC